MTEICDSTRAQSTDGPDAYPSVRVLVEATCKFMWSRTLCSTSCESNKQLIRVKRPYTLLGETAASQRHILSRRCLI